MTTRFARVLIVDDKDRVLVVRQRISGQYLYCYPGGKVEHGESPQRAAAREIFEELGILKSIKGLKFLMRSKFWFSGVCWTGFFYLTTATGRAPSLLENVKVDDARFIPVSDLETLPGDRKSLANVALAHKDKIAQLAEQIRSGCDNDGLF